MRTWIIGSGVDCDVVVAQPTVSDRHCRLTEIADGYLLEDLGSSNGTYINGERIESATRLSARDVATLGKSVAMPWPEAAPAPGTSVVRIGRSPDNDVVLNDPRVTGYHARLIVSGSRTMIEDLGSTNGTFVNSPDQKATQATPLTATDVVYFGSFAVPANRLLKTTTAPDRELRILSPASEPEPSPGPALTHPPTKRRQFDHVTIALLAQSPIIALLIVLTVGRHATGQVTATNWASIGQGIAATMFALGLGAVWLGGSVAVWSAATGRFSVKREGSVEATPLASLGSSLLGLVAVCVAECAVLLTIVHSCCGLRGPWLEIWGVLVIAAGVGLLLGLLVTVQAQNWTTASLVLVIGFLSMVALSGPLLWRPGTDPAVWLTKDAMPSRWAFEGLLVLEADASPVLMPPGAFPVDLAESYFPASSERMGPLAAVLALGGMVAGLSGLLGTTLSVLPSRRTG